MSPFIFGRSNVVQTFQFESGTEQQPSIAFKANPTSGFFDLDGTITGDSSGWMLYQSFGSNNYSPAAKGHNLNAISLMENNGWTTNGWSHFNDGGFGDPNDPSFQIHNYFLLVMLQ
jgi:hypothetical protein